MPTYQYACTNEGCGLNFERVQAFTDAAITECPDCDRRVRKVYGSVGVVFKGSGFYRNDSREAEQASAGSSDCVIGLQSCRRFRIRRDKDERSSDHGRRSGSKSDAGSSRQSRADRELRPSDPAAS